METEVRITDETTRAEAVMESPVLRLGVDGELQLWRGREALAVTVRRCFPWSQPGECLSIRNQENEEVMFIANSKTLDEKSQEALQAALRESGFFFRVRQILEAREEFELRHWVVETDQGRRRFQTRLDEWPRELPGGELLVRDLYGDVYQMSKPSALDAKSRELLWAFVE